MCFPLIAYVYIVFLRLSGSPPHTWKINWTHCSYRSVHATCYSQCHTLTVIMSHNRHVQLTVQIEYYRSRRTDVAAIGLHFLRYCSHYLYASFPRSFMIWIFWYRICWTNRTPLFNVRQLYDSSFVFHTSRVMYTEHAYAV